MVKNTTGGTGAKSLARKHQSSGESSKLRLPDCDLELFGLVTKMLGNGMCEITTNNNARLIGHIRNKFRGKQKRHNLISVFSVVLIGLREWENPRKNCDLLTTYEQSQIEQLRDIPGINIENILKMQFDSTSFKSEKYEKDITFSMDTDVLDGMPKQRMPTTEMFTLEETEEIELDDI